MTIIALIVVLLREQVPSEYYVTETPEKDFETVLMEVTAYCPCVLCCEDWSDNHFADGSQVGDKAIAADTRYYPMGTKMDVPGYGVAIVKDRGGAIKGNKLDVFFMNHKTALQWGRRKNVNVKIRK